MKRFSAPIVFLFFTSFLFGQLNPVNWSFDSKLISENEFEIILTADISEKWVIYSQFLESDNGPIATSFTFEEQSDIEFLGKVEEKGHMKEEYDKLFEMVVKKLSGEVNFIQRIRTTGNVDSVRGYLTFMTCDNMRCLPPKDVEFDISLK